MEGLHFIMLLSMGAAPELKPFSNKVTCICIYMDISLLHVPFYFHVYTLYGHNVNYIGFACSHHWENLVIKYLDSKKVFDVQKGRKKLS